MRTHGAGRHEYGQNFLVDRRVIASFVDLVSRTDGPVLEFGAGDGALTLPLERLGRPLTAVEIDRRHAATLRRLVSPATTVVRGDFLRHGLPNGPCVLVGNLPFHLTTSVLRRVLHADGWTNAVLLVQWEVARRRAAVGGATLMTAQWWPWYEFSLVQRVPAAAFRPRPDVDGGLMTIDRRARPLVRTEQRASYQSFVHRIFTGKGRGLRQILTRAAPAAESEIIQWLDDQPLRAAALPRDLTAPQWADLHALITSRRVRGRRVPALDD
ncbi:23S ribosomal RNA methyltransferase Erm [Spirillospora sp. NPDC052269]